MTTVLPVMNNESRYKIERYKTYPTPSYTLARSFVVDFSIPTEVLVALELTGSDAKVRDIIRSECYKLIDDIVKYVGFEITDSSDMFEKKCRIKLEIITDK